jgi:hypothetical protein
VETHPRGRTEDGTMDRDLSQAKAKSQA